MECSRKNAAAALRPLKPAWYNFAFTQWAASSVGRAPRSQRGGREFEPPAVHHPSLTLDGNHCLCEDPVAELRLEGGGRHELDATADSIAELTLQSHELEQPDRPIEFHQQIDVAVIPTLIACKRTEQRNASDTKSLQQRSAATQGLQDV